MSFGKSIAVYTIVISAFIIGIAPQALGKDIRITSAWMSPPIQIDGHRSDWPLDAVTVLDKDKQDVTIGLGNDSDNVFIMFSFKNPEWAHLIRMAGLALWLDPQGEKGKDFKLTFLGGPRGSWNMKSKGPKPPIVFDGMPSTMPGWMGQRDTVTADSLFCYQKEYYVEEPIPMDGVKGPAAAAGVDSGVFVYEFRIPLAKSSMKIYGLGVPPNRTITVGLVWGDLDSKRMQDDMPTRDDGFNIGGISGGGMSGGRGGFPPGGRMGGHKPKKQEIWLKATLTPMPNATTASPGH